jgi:hypothetical protein
MDQEQTFYEQPVDSTPYSAFIWVIGIAIVVFALASWGVWKLGSWAKAKSFAYSTNHPGATDAFLDKGASALDQAQNAANNAATKAANDAAAAATQALLNQENAAVKAGTDAAKADAAAAASKEATNADAQIQQFVK